MSKKINRIVLWFSFILFHNTFFSQNLILNGDCEQYTECPENPGEIDSLLNFYNFQLCGTSDYINNCSSGFYTSIPNFFGNQDPHSGNGYVHSGLIVKANYTGNGATFAGNIGPYYCQQRENIIGTLSDSLIKDICYSFEVYINFGKYDICGERIAIGNFNVVFFDSLFHPVDAVPPTISENNFEIIDLNPSKQILKDTVNWIPLRASFKAKGGEKYFAFGTFVDTTELQIEYVNCSDSSTGAASYFMDDFSLVKCDTCCGFTPPVLPFDESLDIANSASTNSKPIVFTANLYDNSYAKMEIYDSRGRIVERHTFTTDDNLYTPSISLQKALYHYRFETENGFYQSGKFIVVE